METTLVRVVLTSIGQLAVVHVVLATAVTLDDADDDEQQDQEGQSQNHSDEPSSSDDTVVALWNHHNI